MNNENDLTKLARWGIPGWIAVLSFFTFIGLELLFNSPTLLPLYSSIDDFFNSIPNLDSGWSVLLVAAAGLPVGFSIYQAYFFIRWNSPFSRDGLLPPLQPGRMKDVQRIGEGLLYKHFTQGEQWRKTWVDNQLFDNDHDYQWRYLELLFTEAAQYIDSKSGQVSLYLRHRYLMDVLHTLGASIIAVYIGFAGYFILKISKHAINIPAYILLVGFLLLVLILCLNWENKEKEDRMKDKTRRTNNFQYSPGSLFVVSLVLFVFFGHPLLNPNPGVMDFLLRMIITVSFVLTWIFAKRNQGNLAQIRDLISWFIAILPSIIIYVLNLLPQVSLDNLDWPYLVVVLSFLIVNFILFQNRYNANEDTIALERYVLSLYLVEKSYPSD